LWPLIHNWRNYFYVLQGYAIAGSSLVSLAVVSEWTWFMWLTGLMGGVICWCLGLWLCRRYSLFQEISICRPVGPWEDPSKVISAKHSSYSEPAFYSDSDVEPNKVMDVEITITKR